MRTTRHSSHMENSSPPEAPAPLEAGLAERVVTPALVVDLAAVRGNVRAVLERTGGPGRWRPHVKTAKLRETMAVMADEGLRRFKCATLLELETLSDVLAASAGGDVLVAQHLHGPALARLADLAVRQGGVSVSALVELPEQAARVPGSVRLFVDVDPGMGRTGAPIDDRERILATARAAGPRLAGLHAYDGHRHEADPAARRALVHRGDDRLVELVRALAAEGLAVPEVVTAGTPAFPAALEHPGLATLEGTVHRVSPGTVVYHDLRSRAQNPDLPARFAATVLTRVASLPGEDLFTCDAGSKAIEASGPDRIAAVLELPDAVCLRQSEEHTVFRAPPGRRPERGTLLRLVPGHVCPTVNLATHALLVEEGRLHGVVPVESRGHGHPLTDSGPATVAP